MEMLAHFLAQSTFSCAALLFVAFVVDLVGLMRVGSRVAYVRSTSSIQNKQR